jgi:hypothetical protein
MSENISDQTTAARQRVRNPFLPAWYPPNGIKNAGENELEGASESCERWSIWCGALVIVSILAELIIAIIQPPYDLFLKLSSIPDAGVAVGIVGEVMFGMWNNRIQTELRVRSNARLAGAIAQAAEANVRAAESQRETQRLKTKFVWRELTPDQASKFVTALNGQKISVVCPIDDSDPERSEYARMFVKALENAGLLNVPLQLGPTDMPAPS